MLVMTVVFMIYLVILISIPVLIGVYVYKDAKKKRDESGSLDVDCGFSSGPYRVYYLSSCAGQLFGFGMSQLRRNGYPAVCFLSQLRTKIKGSLSQLFRACGEGMEGLPRLRNTSAKRG